MIVNPVQLRPDAIPPPLGTVRIENSYGTKNTSFVFVFIDIFIVIKLDLYQQLRVIRLYYDYMDNVRLYCWQSGIESME